MSDNNYEAADGMCLPTPQVPSPHLPLPAPTHTHTPIHLELSTNGLLLWQWLTIVSNSMYYQLSHNICQVSSSQSRVHLRSTHSLIPCHHICSYSVAYSAVSILVVPLCCGCCGYCTAGEFHEVVIPCKKKFPVNSSTGVCSVPTRGPQASVFPSCRAHTNCIAFSGLLPLPTLRLHRTARCPPECMKSRGSRWL